MNENLTLFLFDLIQCLTFAFYFVVSFGSRKHRYIASIVIVTGIQLQSYIMNALLVPAYIKSIFMLLYVPCVVFIYIRDIKKSILTAVLFMSTMLAGEMLTGLFTLFAFPDVLTLSPTVRFADMTLGINFWIGEILFNLIFANAMTIIFSIKARVSISIKIKVILLTISVFLLEYIALIVLLATDINISTEIALPVFLVASLVPILIYYIGVFDINQAVELKEKDVLASFSQSKSEQVMEYYKLASHYIKTTHKIKHDISNEIQCLKILIETDKEKSLEYINDINQSLKSIDKGYYTGFSIIDVLLTLKSDLAQEQGIPIDITISKITQSSISEMDMCNLLSNILDNAIEANTKLHEGKRNISFKLGVVGEYLSVKCENNFDGNLVKEGGKLLTSKLDKKSHGYGLSIIKDIVSKYEGENNITIEGNVFSLTVILRNKIE